MFGQIANIATSMVGNIHQPSISFIPFLGWLEFLIPLIPWLFEGIFGKGDTAGTTQDQTQTTTTTALPSGYQSPTLGLNDLLMQAALGKNLSIFGGAGLPRGQTIAPDFLKDFMSLIGSSYTDLQKKTTNPAPIIPTIPSAEEKATVCKNKCSYIWDGNGRETCYQTCMRGGG
jgi:hypothetical protein